MYLTNYCTQMTVTEYSNLPYGISLKEVEKYVDQIIEESSFDSRKATFEKWSEIADRQWHTYELNTKACRRSVQSWLRDNIDTSDPEEVSDSLVIAYLFALDFDFFKELLPHCLEGDRADFEKQLEHVIDGRVDPWWSLRPTNEQQLADHQLPTHNIEPKTK